MQGAPFLLVRHKKSRRGDFLPAITDSDNFLWISCQRVNASGRNVRFRPIADISGTIDHDRLLVEKRGMETEEHRDWTLDEHLAHGRAAVDEISLLPPDAIAEPRVCFHLSPTNSDDDDNWGMDAGYCLRAQATFAHFCGEFDVDYVGGLSGIEAWQSVLPSIEWLERTVPIVFGIADKSGLAFVGWSFEPRSGPFMSISPTLNVYDGNQLGELPTGADVLSFVGLRDWFKRKLG